MEKKSFSLVDEIKSGAYYGNRSEYWKKTARWGMRKSKFQIVNDFSRINLLKEYLKTDDLDIIVYPGCYHEPPHTSR